MKRGNQLLLIQTVLLTILLFSVQIILEYIETLGDLSSAWIIILNAPLSAMIVGWIYVLLTRGFVPIIIKKSTSFFYVLISLILGAISRALGIIGDSVNVFSIEYLAFLILSIAVSVVTYFLVYYCMDVVPLLILKPKRKGFTIEVPVDAIIKSDDKKVSEPKVEIIKSGVSKKKKVSKAKVAKKKSVKKKSSVKKKAAKKKVVKKKSPVKKKVSKKASSKKKSSAKKVVAKKSPVKKTFSSKKSTSKKVSKKSVKRPAKKKVVKKKSPTKAQRSKASSVQNSKVSSKKTAKKKVATKKVVKKAVKKKSPAKKKVSKKDEVYIPLKVFNNKVEDKKRKKKTKKVKK